MILTVVLLKHFRKHVGDNELFILYNNMAAVDLYPVLLTWFNFNPSMDK